MAFSIAGGTKEKVFSGPWYPAELCKEGSTLYEVGPNTSDGLAC